LYIFIDTFLTLVFFKCVCVCVYICVCVVYYAYIANYVVNLLCLLYNIYTYLKLSAGKLHSSNCWIIYVYIYGYIHLLDWIFLWGTKYWREETLADSNLKQFWRTNFGNCSRVWDVKQLIPLVEIFGGWNFGVDPPQSAKVFCQYFVLYDISLKC